MPPTHHSTQPDHCSAGAGSTGQSKQRTREKGREDRERDVERSPRPLGSSRGAHNYPSPNAAAPPSPGEAAEEALAPTRSYKVLMRYSHQVHRLRPLQLCTQNAACGRACRCGVRRGYRVWCRRLPRLPCPNARPLAGRLTPRAREHATDTVVSGARPAPATKEVARTSASLIAQSPLLLLRLTSRRELARAGCAARAA